MIIRYIGIDNSNKSIIKDSLNFKQNERSLQVGKKYIVFEITIYDSSIYYTIFNGRHLFKVPSANFEIIDGSVYDKWIMKQDEDMEINIYPELFYREDFLENHSEWEDKERQEFKELAQEFEKINDNHKGLCKFDY